MTTGNSYLPLLLSLITSSFLIRSYLHLTNIHSLRPFLSPNQVANYEVDKVEVSVKVDNDTTISSLTLRDAQVHNSGQYTCSPSNAKTASIRVHVLSGKSSHVHVGVNTEVNVVAE